MTQTPSHRALHTREAAMVAALRSAWIHLDEDHPELAGDGALGAMRFATCMGKVELRDTTRPWVTPLPGGTGEGEGGDSGMVTEPAALVAEQGLRVQTQDFFAAHRLPPCSLGVCEGAKGGAVLAATTVLKRKGSG